MKKRSVSLAIAGLALGFVLTGAVAANAITFPGLNCTNGVGGTWVGIGFQASGTATATVVNGPSSWGKTFAYSSTIVTHNYAASTHLSSASYLTTSGGTFGWSANGCYASPGWT